MHVVEAVRAKGSDDSITEGAVEEWQCGTCGNSGRGESRMHQNKVVAFQHNSSLAQR